LFVFSTMSNSFVWRYTVSQWSNTDGYFPDVGWSRIVLTTPKGDLSLFVDKADYVYLAPICVAYDTSWKAYSDSAQGHAFCNASNFFGPHPAFEQRCVGNCIGLFAKKATAHSFASWVDTNLGITLFEAMLVLREKHECGEGKLRLKLQQEILLERAQFNKQIVDQRVKYDQEIFEQNQSWVNKQELKDKVYAKALNDKERTCRDLKHKLDAATKVDDDDDDDDTQEHPNNNDNKKPRVSPTQPPPYTHTKHKTANTSVFGGKILPVNGAQPADEDDDVKVVDAVEKIPAVLP
jgi:hypothetical protein